MDYIILSAIIGTLLMLFISYDIACQWSRNFPKRVQDFAPEMRINFDKTQVRYAIPKKHIRVHGPDHSRYSLNFLPRVGRTYGEGIESHWSHMNPVATSTREMSPAMRHEVMDDHWASWNWQKIIGLGTPLSRLTARTSESLISDYHRRFSAEGAVRLTQKRRQAAESFHRVHRQFSGRDNHPVE